MRRITRKLGLSFHHGEKGFTLIELLIVLLILGIITAAVVPNIGRFTRVGIKGAAESELGTIQVAVYAAMTNHRTGIINGETPISSSNGVIHGSEIIDVDDYLQGGISGLEGSWTYNLYGLITDGRYPVTAPHWVYDHDADPQWQYEE